MKFIFFVSILFTVFGIQTARCAEWSLSPDRSTTLAELSKAPGVRVKVGPLPKEEYIPEPAHPINEVTILFFPGATLFSPDFFKNFQGEFSPNGERSMFSSGLKLYLDVCGADQAVLARVPVVYNVVSDADASEQHFKITFLITPEAMKHSYLEVVEMFPRSGTHPMTIYLGASPEKK